jgi:hypothetical protein
MASTEAIRTAIAAQLTAALGDGYQVSAYALSAPTPPAFEVLPGLIRYHQAMGDTVSWRGYRVRGFFSLSSDIGSQQKADAFFEDDPILAALEADPTLDGACDDLIVDQAEPAFFDLPGLQGPCVGGVWTLRILT